LLHYHSGPGHRLGYSGPVGYCAALSWRAARPVAFRIALRDLSALVGELNALRADANHWLEYGPLRLRLESAHAAVEAALVEARRRVRLNEGS
jgi:hypothetical protein